MINSHRVQVNRKIGINSISDQYQLLIDGSIVGIDQIVEIPSPRLGEKFFAILSDNSDSSHHIASLLKQEFIYANILSIAFNNWTEFGIFSVNIQFTIDILELEKTYLEVTLLADLLLWNRHYTFIDYLIEFEQWIELRKIGKIENDGVGTTITVKIEIAFGKQTISEEIDLVLQRLIDIHYSTLGNLDANHYDESILTSFNFPEELKIACEQYLQYFAEFIQDLGIKVTSDLKEEAGKVLFSVTPIDDVEALDKIREALAVYLNLPSSPIIYDDSFAAIRLKQQVDNLQHAQRMAETEARSSQLALRVANQAIEHQDKIIQQKETTIEQQNKIIERITDKAVMINSADNKEELVKMYEGLEFSHSKWLFELTGIKVNPIKVIERGVKNTLGKAEEIISLDLDKGE